MHSDSSKTDNKVYFESEGGASYQLTKNSHRGFGGPRTHRETEKVVGRSVERCLAFWIEVGEKKEVTSCFLAAYLIIQVLSQISDS